MKMFLIIAEKPSLGRNIAAALGATEKGDGFLIGGGYIVTWAFGHLFSLCDIYNLIAYFYYLDSSMYRISKYSRF